MGMSWTARRAANPHGQVYPIRAASAGTAYVRSSGIKADHVPLQPRGPAADCISKRRSAPSSFLVASHAQPNLTATYMLNNAEPCIDLERHMQSGESRCSSYCHGGIIVENIAWLASARSVYMAKLPIDYC